MFLNYYCRFDCYRERTIALYRSSDSYVVQARSWLPDAVGGVIWFGPAAAHSTIYVPVLAGMQSAPDTLQYGWQGVYNTSTAYWANRRVLNIAQTKFSYMIELIRQVQNTLEAASVQLIGDVTAKLSTPVRRSSSVDSKLLSVFEEIFAANALKATLEMNKLFNFLLFSYPDGYLSYWDESGFHASSLGYPVWWLEAGNYVDGPPPVATTSLQKQLMTKEAARERIAESHAPKLSWATHTQSVPGLVPISAAESSQSQLLQCLQACSAVVEDNKYRACSETCAAQHA